jgi:glyoxylase-like metal-dependent hydrolase (beta-lactamase superfamily II)
MASGEEILQLTPSVWCIGQHSGGRVHAFLLDDGQGLTLVDTLFDTDGARVLRQIEAMGRKPADLRNIVVTHGHRSHVGGVAALREATGAAVHAHEWEADIVSGDREAQRISMIPGRPYRTWYPIQIGLALGKGRQPGCPVDNFVAGGDRVGPLHVLDASGHSPGHLAFLWPEQNLLIAGDTVCTWPSIAAGWPALNLNLRKHHAALRRLAETEAEILGVGHGSPLPSGGHARIRELVDALGR